MTEHLGYDKGSPPRGSRGNSRNGATAKTLRTELGDVPIEVPRDGVDAMASPPSPPGCRAIRVVAVVPVTWVIGSLGERRIANNNVAACG